MHVKTSKSSQYFYIGVSFFVKEVVQCSNGMIKFCQDARFPSSSFNLLTIVHFIFAIVSRGWPSTCC